MISVALGPRSDDEACVTDRFAQTMKGTIDGVSVCAYPRLVHLSPHAERRGELHGPNLRRVRGRFIRGRLGLLRVHPGLHGGPRRRRV